MSFGFIYAVPVDRLPLFEWLCARTTFSLSIYPEMETEVASIPWLGWVVQQRMWEWKYLFSIPISYPQIMSLSEEPWFWRDTLEPSTKTSNKHINSCPDFPAASCSLERTSQCESGLWGEGPDSMEGGETRSTNKGYTKGHSIAALQAPHAKKKSRGKPEWLVKSMSRLRRMHPRSGGGGGR